MGADRRRHRHLRLSPGPHVLACGPRRHQGGVCGHRRHYRGPAHAAGHRLQGERHLLELNLNPDQPADSFVPFRCTSSRQQLAYSQSPLQTRRTLPRRPPTNLRKGDAME